MTIGPYPTGQQGDVRMYQTADDGEINATGGIIEMSGGFETAAYLSLFGGNFRDDGSQDTPFSWWGNLDITDPTEQYISRTQNLLQGLPAVSSNLRRLEEAAKADLEWMVTVGAANSVAVTVTMVAPKRVEFTIDIVADAEKISLVYLANWEALQAAAAIPGTPDSVWTGEDWAPYVDGLGDSYVDGLGNTYTGVP